MTFKRSFSLQLRLVETIEIDEDGPPSLPPMPVVEATGVCVEETIRPLAKVIPFAASLKRLRLA